MVASQALSRNIPPLCSSKCNHISNKILITKVHTYCHKSVLRLVSQLFQKINLTLTLKLKRDGVLNIFSSIKEVEIRSRLLKHTFAFSSQQQSQEFIHFPLKSIILYSKALYTGNEMTGLSQRTKFYLKAGRGLISVSNILVNI